MWELISIGRVANRWAPLTKAFNFAIGEAHPLILLRQSLWLSVLFTTFLTAGCLFFQWFDEETCTELSLYPGLLYILPYGLTRHHVLALVFSELLTLI